MDNAQLKQGNKIQKQLDRLNDRSIAPQLVDRIHLVDLHGNHTSSEDIKNYGSDEDYRTEVENAGLDYIQAINQAIINQRLKLTIEFAKL